MTHQARPQTPTRSRPVLSTSRRGRHLMVVGMFGAALLLAACSNGGSAMSSTKATSAPAAAAAPASSGSTAPDAITIRNFSFAPTAVTVAPGATVTVTNKDQVAHTITSATGGFDTGDIGPGQSGTFTAPKTPGRYSYICSIHQYMTGTLVVSG